MDNKKLYRLVGIDLRRDGETYPDGSLVELDDTTARALRPWLEFVSEVEPAQEPPPAQEAGKEEPPAPTQTADEKPAQESGTEEQPPAKAKTGTAKEGK